MVKNYIDYETYYPGIDNFSDSQITKMLDVFIELQFTIETRKRYEIGFWKDIIDKLILDWTYNSNAIEGSSLTKDETLFFLQTGLTVEGKPLKDFLDARNHFDAVEYLLEIIRQDRAISTSVLKEFNALLLTGLTSTPALDQFGNRTSKPATPGEYKKNPNHVLQNDGTIHRYADPLQVPAEMEFLCEWIHRQREALHPEIIASIAHYNFVRIHPFDDGNGRGARILMNLILMQSGFQPAVIKNERRREYIAALTDADKGSIRSFILFVLESCIETQQSILNSIPR